MKRSILLVLFGTLPATLLWAVLLTAIAGRGLPLHGFLLGVAMFVAYKVADDPAWRNWEPGRKP